MANITKTFAYNVPDEYLSTTSSGTAEFTYIGPAFLWVFVNKATGTWDHRSSFIPDKNGTDRAEEARVRAGIDQVAVLLDPGNSDDDATLASLVVGFDTGEASGYPQKEYKFPAGHANAGEVYYKRPDPIAPDHAYEVDEITYNVEKKEWNKPWPWHKPYINMEMHQAARDAVLAESIKVKEELKDLLVASQLAVFDNYKTEMENIYTKYAGIEPYMIGFPDSPQVGLIPDYDYTVDPDGVLD